MVTAAPQRQPPTTEQPAAPDSLDPADWPAFRRAAHRLLDDALNLVEGVRERAVWQAVPDDIKTAIAEPLPKQPQGFDQVADDMRRLVLPYGTGNIHPRFFGWVHGTGTPGGIAAEMVAAALNANVGGRDHGAVYVERQVIGWFRELFGFPATTSGLLVSGTSTATMIGLAIARNRAIGDAARASGLAAANGQLVAYTSREAHSSVAKAFEMLGLGNRALRSIAVTPSFAIDAVALKAAIAADRAAGLQPFAVIATAGTVNTGAIDPIDEIASIAGDEGLWLHVDGAFGALAILAPEQQHRLAGIDRADSLAFDFHKWLHVPYDAGCLLVRDGAAHLAAFSTRPVYLAGHERGLAAGEPWFCEFGPELSRGFRALKVWATIKEHGFDRLGAMIAKNCRQAAQLAARVVATPGLELLAPADLNIVCFRVRPADLSAAAVDQLNGDIVVALQERGIAAPSTTRIGGQLAIRVNITNHRTEARDIDLLIDSILDLAGELHDRSRQTD